MSSTPASRTPLASWPSLRRSPMPCPWSVQHPSWRMVRGWPSRPTTAVRAAGALGLPPKRPIDRTNCLSYVVRALHYQEWPFKGENPMRLGVYNAILHDRPLPEALTVIANLGLTGIEINTGGFLPPVHVPTFDQILESDAARDDYLGIFEGTGVSIAGLNCNGNPLHPKREIGEKDAED